MKRKITVVRIFTYIKNRKITGVRLFTIYKGTRRLVWSHYLLIYRKRKITVVRLFTYIKEQEDYSG